MKADIINTNYFNETKLYKIYRIVLILFGISIGIYFIIDWLITPLNNYENFYYTFIVIFMSIIILTEVLGSILFTRIGTIEFSGNMLIIDHSEIKNSIDLTKVSQVKLKKQNREFYSFSINQHAIMIELTEYTIIKFKNILKNYQIKIN